MAKKTPGRRWADVAEQVNPDLGEYGLRNRSCAKRDIVREAKEKSANVEIRRKEMMK